MPTALLTRKRFLALLLLAFSISAAGQSKPIQWTEYKDSKRGFRISYPADYYKKEDLNRVSFVAPHSAPGEDPWFYVSVSLNDPLKQNIPWWVKSFKELREAPAGEITAPSFAQTYRKIKNI